MNYVRINAQIQSRVSSTFELETINPVKSYRQMTSLQDITHIIQHKVTLKGKKKYIFLKLIYEFSYIFI